MTDPVTQPSATGPDFAGVLAAHTVVAFSPLAWVCACDRTWRRHDDEPYAGHVTAPLNAALVEWLQSEPVIEHMYLNVLAYREPERDDLREAFATLTHTAARVQP